MVKVSAAQGHPTVYEATNTRSLELRCTGASADPARVEALTSVVVNGQPIVLTATGTSTTLTAYLLDPATGALSVGGQIDMSDGIGFQGFTALSTAQIGNITYVIAAGAGSSSLTVFSLSPSGSLIPVDHAVDMLETRFSGAAIVESFTFGDQAFVLTSGGDDGVSLFQLLPDGHLLYLESLSDSNDLPLENISAMAVDVAQHPSHRASRLASDLVDAHLGAQRIVRDDGGDAERLRAERQALVSPDPAQIQAVQEQHALTQEAAELAERHGWFLASQFENPANPAYHRSTTGPEILRDFAGKRLDYFVTGWGTGGTLTGVGQVLKLARPGIQVVTSEPAGAQLLNGKDWAPHKIQGWTPDFVPAVLDRGLADQVRPVDDLTARDTARRLAAEEGVFVGLSAGATVAAALQVARDAPDGSVILAMLPDTGERYLSTILFEGVNEGSDDDWLAGLP